MVVVVAVAVVVVRELSKSTKAVVVVVARAAVVVVVEVMVFALGVPPLGEVLLVDHGAVDVGVVMPRLGGVQRLPRGQGRALFPGPSPLCAPFFGGSGCVLHLEEAENIGGAACWDVCV